MLTKIIGARNLVVRSPARCNLGSGCKEHCKMQASKTNINPISSARLLGHCEKYKSVLIVNHDSPDKSTMFIGQAIVYYELLKEIWVH